MEAGAQIVTFEGRGLIHKNGTVKVLIEGRLGIIFSDLEPEEILGNFPDFAAVKFNGDYRQIL